MFQVPGISFDLLLLRTLLPYWCKWFDRIIVSNISFDLILRITPVLSKWFDFIVVFNFSDVLILLRDLTRNMTNIGNISII